MNCMFNESNPSDHPAVIKITRPGQKPQYVLTNMATISNDNTIWRLRQMDKYLVKRVCFKRDMVIEAINVFPREIRMYIERNILPDGMYEKNECPFAKEYFSVLNTKVTGISRMEI